MHQYGDKIPILPNIGSKSERPNLELREISWLNDDLRLYQNE